MREKDSKNSSTGYSIHLITVPERKERTVGREELASTVKEGTQRLMTRKKLRCILVKIPRSTDTE